MLDKNTLDSIQRSRDGLNTPDQINALSVSLRRLATEITDLRATCDAKLREVFAVVAPLCTEDNIPGVAQAARVATREYSRAQLGVGAQFDEAARQVSEIARAVETSRNWDTRRSDTYARQLG